MPDTSLGITYPASTAHTRIWEHLQTLADDVNTLMTTGRLSGSRIATAVEDTDSATFSTVETSLTSVAASLTTGRTYRIRLVTHIGTTVTNDTATVRVREDTVAGTELFGDVSTALSSSTVGTLVILEGEYTAVATASKTFVATAVRSGGTGLLRREAATTRATYLYVDYIRG